MMDSTAPLEKPRLRPWRELVALALIGMQVSWVSLWFRIFTQTGLFVSFWRAFSILASIFCTVYVLTRLAYLWRLKAEIQRGMLVLLSAASLLVGLRSLLYVNSNAGAGEIIRRIAQAFSNQKVDIPAEFTLMLAILWVCWRGASLAESQIEQSGVRQSFVLGAVMLFAYGLVAPLTEEVPIAAVYIFLFFGLLSLSTARILVIGNLRGGQSIPFNRQWLAGILLTVLGVLGLAGVLVFLMQWKLAELIVGTLIWVVRLIFIAGMVLMAPVMLLLLEALPALAAWLRQFNFVLQQLNAFFQEFRNLIERLMARFSFQLHLDLPFLKPFLLWGGLLLVALVVLISLRMRYRGELAVIEEEDSSIQSKGPGSPGTLLLSGLQALFGKLAGRMSLNQAGRLLAAARIRRTYAQLIALSAQLGKPRSESQTPLEFLPVLERVFPAFTADLGLITHAYLRTRYGELPETVQELEQVEAAWRRISAEGQKLSKAARKKAEGSSAT